jgi:hypothetical protein
VLSVTFPVDLDLVVVVLEELANDVPDRKRAETKTTKKRSRDFMESTNLPGKILVALDFVNRGQQIEDLLGNPNSIAIVSESFYRAQ